MFTNRGAVALKKVIEEREGPQRLIADRLGVEVSWLWRLANGKFLPSLAVALKAEEAFGINPGWWSELIEESVSTSPDSASPKGAA